MKCPICGTELYITQDEVWTGTYKNVLSTKEWLSCRNCSVNWTRAELAWDNVSEDEETETDLEKQHELKQGSTNPDEFPENNIG